MNVLTYITLVTNAKCSVLVDGVEGAQVIAVLEEGTKVHAVEQGNDGWTKITAPFLGFVDNDFLEEN
ncbi:MAG: SH3 domain-containing protein [Bacilli bacterium]